MHSKISSHVSPPLAEWEMDMALPPDTLHTLHELFHQHGDIYQIATTEQDLPGYVVSHPDMVHQVLASHHKKYIRGASNDRLAIILGKGLLVSEGAHWKAQRKIMQPSFHEKVLAKFSNLLEECNQNILDKWQAQITTKQPINLIEDMLELTLQFNLRALFGEDADLVLEHAGTEFFSRLTEESQESIENNLLFIKRFRMLKELINTIIERRREIDSSSYDFLAMFMNSTYKDSGETMSNGQIIDEVMNLLTAGHVTAANALKWTWYMISQNPEIEQKLHAELDEVLKGRLPTVADLPLLVYTKQIIEETLRLYPPLWLITRQASSEDNISGYHVPLGTQIIMSTFIIHRHPDFWDDPDTFNPDRFTPEAKKQQHKCAFIPFATGPRNCIGSQLSMWEMLLHIGTIAQHMKLSFIEGSSIELEPGFVLRSKQVLHMQPEQRQHA